VGAVKTKSLSDAIHQRMKARKLSLRDVDALSQDLAEREPGIYERVSRPTLHTLITQPDVAVRTLSPARLRTLVALLWDGDYQGFVEETGLAVVAPANGEPAAKVAVTVPVYLEGESAQGPAARREEPALPCDLLFVPTSGRIACLPLNEPVGVRATERIEEGDLVVLERLGSGLEAVWATKGGYVYDDEEAPPPKPSDKVIGVVTWVRPKRVS